MNFVNKPAASEIAAVDFAQYMVRSGYSVMLDPEIVPALFDNQPVFQSASNSLIVPMTFHFDVENHFDQISAPIANHKALIIAERSAPVAAYEPVQRYTFGAEA